MDMGILLIARYPLESLPLAIIVDALSFGVPFLPSNAKYQNTRSGWQGALGGNDNTILRHITCHLWYWNQHTSLKFQICIAKYNNEVNKQLHEQIVWSDQ
jgi:hypothetical protein